MGRSVAVADTALGAVAVVWGESGIVGLLLPERDRAALDRRMARRFPDALPAEAEGPVRDAIGRIVDLLAGRDAAFDDTPVDLAATPDFDRRVYGVARTIRRGQTLTYGAVAAAIGDRNAAREVGAALGRNPVPVIVPCHRVLPATGRAGGFSAPGGTATKLRLLALEGAAPGGQPDLFG